MIDAGAVPVLVALKDDMEFRLMGNENVLAALASHGSEAATLTVVAALVDRLRSGSPMAPWGAAKLLHEILSDCSAARHAFVAAGGLPILIPLLRKGGMDIKYHAAATLGSTFSMGLKSGQARRHGRSLLCRP